MKIEFNYPQSPFYTLPTGARSCYSHVVMAGLAAFIEAAGEPDLAVYRAVLQVNRFSSR